MLDLRPYRGVGDLIEIGASNVVLQPQTEAQAGSPSPLPPAPLPPPPPPPPRPSPSLSNGEVGSGSGDVASGELSGEIEAEAPASPPPSLPPGAPPGPPTPPPSPPLPAAPPSPPPPFQSVLSSPTTANATLYEPPLLTGFVPAFAPAGQVVHVAVSASTPFPRVGARPWCGFLADPAASGTAAPQSNGNDPALASMTWVNARFSTPADACEDCLVCEVGPSDLSAAQPYQLFVTLNAPEEFDSGAGVQWSGAQGSHFVAFARDSFSPHGTPAKEADPSRRAQLLLTIRGFVGAVPLDTAVCRFQAWEEGGLQQAHAARVPAWREAGDSEDQLRCLAPNWPTEESGAALYSRVDVALIDCVETRQVDAAVWRCLGKKITHQLTS